MTNRPKGIRGHIARISLNVFFDAVLRGETPSISTLVHRYSAQGPELFRDELLQLVEERDSKEMLTFLKAVARTGLKDWIPPEFLPRFVFLDLEYCPHTEKIKEAAILVSDALGQDADPVHIKDAGGLSAARLKEFFEKALPPPPFFLTGHNLIEFDLVKLEEHGLSWDAPVLDTLQLSLLSEPTRAVHSLDGEHTAASDVVSNLECLRALDSLWMSTPPGVVRTLSKYLSAGGLKAYLEWVLLRRPQEEESQPLESFLQPTRRMGSPESNASSALPASRLGELSHGHLSPREIQERLSGDKTVCLAFSRQTVRTVRYLVRQSSGSLLQEGTALSDDRTIRDKALRTLLGREEWDFPKAYLACWRRAGGQYSHELHPFLQIDPHSPEWEELFAPVSATGTAAVIDHQLWFRKASSGKATIFECEELIDPLSLCTARKVHLRDPEFMEVLEAFLVRRVLAPTRREGAPVQVLIDASVRGEQTYQALFQHLQSSDSSLAQEVAEVLQESDTSLLSIREETDRVFVSVLEASPQPQLLGQRLRESPLFTGCARHSPLVRRLTQQYGLTLSSDFPESQRTPFLVAEDGAFGSWTGMPRTLVVCARHILSDQSAKALVLGLGADYQLAAAAAFRLSGFEAHHSHRYGSQSRTVQRTVDQPAHFLAGWHTASLPEYSQRCLLARLPFPGRTHPQVELASALDPELDVYKDVVLPLMLKRLSQLVQLARHQGLPLVLLDRRATEFGFHRELEQTVGPIRLVEAPKSPPEALETVRENLQKKLEELRLATPRQLFANIDSFPVLRRVLGATAGWRDHQEMIVTRILQGESLLAVLPTGSGKSICFQVPALLYGELADRLTIVFSPLRALMRDQVQGLRKRGVQGVDCYHGELSSEERQRVVRDIRSGWTVLLYLAPEQILNPSLKQVLLERGVSLVVVDEAHCISEWGHDFRPEYQKIPELVYSLTAERAESPPQVVAFTATATKLVQKELIQTLSLSSDAVVVPLKRSNLHPLIEPFAEGQQQEKMERLVKFIQDRAGQSGLVYVTTRDNTEKVCQTLQQRCAPHFDASQIGFLHSKVPNRPKVESDFIEADGPTKILVCTTAFGMGIDKPDISWIVHYDAPGSLESYAQEIGRAGRDASIQAQVLAMVSPEDLRIRFRMSDPLEDSEVEIVLDYLRRLFPEGGNVQCDLARLAEECGFSKEEKAKVALFALERTGIIHVESWGLRVSFVTRGPSPEDETLSQLERRLLALVPPGQTEPTRICCDQLARMWGEHRPEELDRSLQGLIQSGYLCSHRLLEIHPSGPDSDVALDQWDKLEEQLAGKLQSRFESAQRAYLELSFADLLGDLEGAGDLESLERILCWWRAGRLIFQEKGLLRLRLSRNSRKDFLAEVAAHRRLRRQTWKELQQLWKKSVPAIIPWRGRSQSFADGLAMLQSRGIVHWEDEANPTQRLRIFILTESEEDALRLARLDLRVKKRSSRYRLQELERFFSEKREGDEVWRFLQAYFDRDSPSTPETEQQTKRILRGLTSQQQATVVAPRSQPLLINAGAGTGKTHVLARRLLMLQALDLIDPRQVLVLSFSRAGAAAIGERVAALAKELKLYRVRTYTFHSFAYQLIRMFGETRRPIGFCRVPRAMVRKDWEAGKYLNEVLVNHYQDILGSRKGLNTPVETILAYSQLFDSLRSGHPDLEGVILRPEELWQSGLPDTLQIGESQGSLPLDEVRLAFRDYIRKLHQLGTIDFAGMVANCLLLLRENKSIRRQLQGRLKHLLVDEFQDTSRAQEEIMRAIVGPSASVTVVGDSDQTIYTFNGSDVRNILCFDSRNKRIWPHTETAILPLEENFRSTARILSLSNDVIRNNKKRLPKQLRTSEVQPNKNRASYRQRNSKVQLFPTDSLTAGLAAAYRTVQSWLSQGVDPGEIAVLSRMNPSGNNQKAALDRLEEVFRSEGVPLAGSSRRGQEQFLELLKKSAAVDGGQSLLEAESFLRTRAGAVFGVAKRDILEMGLKEALQMGAESVNEWLAIAEAAQLSPKHGLHSGSGLHLKTIHSVKGEEYRRVFVLHLADKFFPTALSKDIEEERRLLYVALTRAEELLAVSGEPGARFFEELKVAGGEELEIREGSWTLPVPSYEPEPEYRIEKESASEKEDEEGEDDEVDSTIFEAEIGQTNLLSAFRAWKGDK